MNYRNMTDRELIAFAETASFANDHELRAELLYRLARSVQHPLSTDVIGCKQDLIGSRKGALPS